ncbi:hypothetical protein PFISCL1PPCAC_27264 [Pristionchus fissidentatus]|uniref:Dehydrogenase n=1 Tax=Pristionchus fissidentatus TaxID=1538716 RepID=A0AAV5X1K3_9BILA|nr:hypothetical protein PFISCL1PPCAC_27264 [Pristionchus fissidentatus]
MKKSLFITGTNRGMGLGLVKELLKNTSIGTLIAGARNLENAQQELRKISDPRLHFVEIDVQKEETIKDAFLKVFIEDIVGSSGLDILFNNAGVLIPVSVETEIDRDAARLNFDVNAIGTLSVIQNFKPLLDKAVVKNGSAQIVNISSILASMQKTFGSFGDRHFTGYAMSKAAVNMLTRCLSIDWKDQGIRVTTISPGWVQTTMGGEGATTTVDESASGLATFVMKLGEEHNGKYFNFDSAPIEW